MVKTLSNTTAQAVLLIPVLSFYAWSLAQDIGRLRAGRTRLADIAAVNLRLAYRRPAGVAIDGTLVAPAPDQNKYVAFLLRGQSLQHDLDFWIRAKKLMDSRQDIGLFGYCDSQQCVDAIRKLQPLSFPVLAYGEAAGIQAVVNEDVRGRAILQIVGKASPLEIAWRDPRVSPEDAVQGAIR